MGTKSRENQERRPKREQKVGKNQERRSKWEHVVGKIGKADQNQNKKSGKIGNADQNRLILKNLEESSSFICFNVLLNHVVCVETLYIEKISDGQEEK